MVVVETGRESSGRAGETGRRRRGGRGGESRGKRLLSPTCFRSFFPQAVEFRCFRPFTCVAVFGEMSPKPENVSGEKVEQHVFKHEINWGHVAISLAVLFVGYVLYRGIVEEDDEE